MNEDYPDNRVLLKFMEIEFGHVKDHLTTLNGQVNTNTEFRLKSLGIYIGISSIMAVIVTGINFLV
jgi:hypothetical protein